jgi:phosphatidylserine/phosphatidylglycerophosphate/cardiolipin synthase-like enzyme
MQGETIWMGMFYLADRKVLDGLLEAAARGVDIRLILDPNQNAFGQKKVGIPNRPVAAELMEKSGGKIKIRWYNTGEEQYHTKLMLVLNKQESTLNGGSVNFTPRNLDDLNLETNLEIKASPDTEVIRETESYFKRLWQNDGAEYTVDYPTYEDKTTPVKKAIYKLQTILGFTTF